jgi:hypothetical protein
LIKSWISSGVADFKTWFSFSMIFVARSEEMSLTGSGIDTGLQVKDLLKDIYTGEDLFELDENERFAI